ncbi:hypothetical protein SAMN05216282_1369 [Cryobacterium psychrotolerans]|uniref:Uncharacterized protein n=1 Tax=Cryobacterium psychrotolerans TaxID=386301 RepID=A0A1G9HRI0_9MICO|nr:MULTISPECIES: hypothetical protein [Cryobacterium]TFD42432.1 hypothetical protein E3T33_12500 [Cryobacterium sp. TMT1-2-1]TFD83951.1 hypothetical protein E3T56_11690 [Cryobacterium psychrotolerans]SDL15568.1 hypothetical protein SAMN05216282_1369 [Cryobacterium psychrotolerans]
MSDPTRVTSQPALTTSSGRSWLVVGALFTAIALSVLIPMTSLPPSGVALTGAITVAALYGGMLVVRVTVSRGRRRLRLLAAGLIAIAIVSVITAGIVAATVGV